MMVRKILAQEREELNVNVGLSLFLKKEKKLNNRYPASIRSSCVNVTPLEGRNPVNDFISSSFTSTELISYPRFLKPLKNVQSQVKASYLPQHFPLLFHRAD